MVFGWTKMDPQSLAFTPQNNDIYRLSNAMRTFQETQQEHTERLSRLERQRDDDHRIKSVWGPTSPFPGILGGTPQHGISGRTIASRSITDAVLQGPTNHPTVDFANFDDDHSNSMVRSLHLDADDEPRRYGASRANSVRFDDSAKPGQWAHATRSSVDLPSRAGSSFGPLGGGHSMFERSQSHKSDGKSSIGQAAASSRANSLMLDTSSQPYTPAAEDPPSLAPGLLILGAVPSIIRCWLTDNFKHDALLYAAVCTGSYKSYLDLKMVESLGLSRQVCQDLSGDRKIKLPVYLPEAVPLPASSRSSTPNSQLPSVFVDFTVIERSPKHSESKAIQIFIGSDTLRAHNSDVLFSSNTLTLFDDERIKLSIPLVRPENDETFKGLFCTTAAPSTSKLRPGLALDMKSESYISPNGVATTQQRKASGDTAQAFQTEPPVSALLQEPEQADEPNTASTRDTDAIQRLQEGQKRERVSFEAGKSVETREAPVEESPPMSATPRNASSSATWGSWRRDGSTGSQPTNQSDRSGSASSSRPNRDQGIRVLKPARTISRSNASPMPGSPSTSGQSRFFDEGKRRGGPGDASDVLPPPSVRRSISGESARGMALGRDGVKDGSSLASQPAVTAPKTRGLNPIGGASAFGWLNSAGK